MTADNELNDSQWYRLQPQPKVSYSTFYKRRKSAYSREDALVLTQSRADAEREWYTAQPPPKTRHTTFHSRRNRGYSRHEALNPYLFITKKEIHHIPTIISLED